MSKSNDDIRKQKAVALKYSPQTNQSPIIVASGYGYVAEKIIDIADSSGVPVFRDANAVSLLSMLEVGANIPPELYQVVANIYLAILKMADEKGKSIQLVQSLNEKLNEQNS
ncbi:MAG TPA: hypothetical protein DCP97_04075 [Ruminococcaceae bacterium]|nr:hypothetical protein [Oscillospiraceae bacterium]